MEATRLSFYKENTYIPPVKTVSVADVPEYHPCLIVQDSQSESKLKECGCADMYCVKKHTEWIPRAK